MSQNEDESNGVFCCESKVQLDHKYKVVHAMVRFLYFGGLPMDTLTSLDCLDLLGLADDVEVGGGSVEKGSAPNREKHGLFPFDHLLVNPSELQWRNPSQT